MDERLRQRAVLSLLAIMINGGLVDPEAATISVMDHGFLYGDLVYEVVKTRNRAFFAAGMHLQRLRYSASKVDIPIPWDNRFLLEEMKVMERHLDVPDCYLRLVITRGTGPLNINPLACHDPVRILYGKDLPRQNEAFYEDGAGIWVIRPTPTEKGNIKSGVYRNNVTALKEAREQGCHEALLLNKEGTVAECTTSNIFWVRDNVLHTPALKSGILKGVTRTLVMGLTAEMEIQVMEDVYHLEHLLAAEEVFITSTTRDVMPISRVGDKHFSVGPITRELMARFDDLGEVDPSF